MSGEKQTIPTSAEDASDAAILVAESYQAPDGSVYVHKDLVQVVEPWAVEQHVSPPSETHSFGDVQSWAAYVGRYGSPLRSLLSWREAGLVALLDHHDPGGVCGRNQWKAQHAFQYTPEFKAWRELTSGAPLKQAQLVEALEDLAETIIQPDPGQLMAMLRTLRATVNTEAASALREDGGMAVEFRKDSQVRGDVALPQWLEIQLSMIRGYRVQDADGVMRPALHRLRVRLRPSVTETAQLVFRLSIPAAERVLEEIYLDLVAMAQEELGEAYRILRA